MQVSRSTQSATEFTGNLLVLGRYEEGERSSDEAAIGLALNGALGAAAERLYFKGKATDRRPRHHRPLTSGSGDSGGLG